VNTSKYNQLSPLPGHHAHIRKSLSKYRSQRRKTTTAGISHEKTRNTTVITDIGTPRDI
jgi:hypothetical protein